MFSRPIVRVLPWLLPGVVVVALALRFGMRVLGVRPDVPFPGLIYSLTAPLVEPFYRWFPVTPRFDENAVEVASLMAAGVVLALTLLVYVVVLLLARPSVADAAPIDRNLP
jgi:hypothetical protein